MDYCPYRILSLDGGGIRGIITAILLERLEAACPGYLASVDLFVGTSTGGILALALAAGFPPSKIINLYEENADVIFKKDFFRRVVSLGKLVGAEYDNLNLHNQLTKLFGGLRLADLEKRVAIPTFLLDTKDKYPSRGYAPKIFHNYPGIGSDGDAFVTDVALYTTAAPTYFPTVDGYIDGGVVANNPSMVALAQALDMRCQIPSEPGRELSDLVMLSIGTGTNLTYISGDRLDWGVAEWARPLLEILMDGVAEIADFQCRQLLGDKFQRLQVVFGQNEKLALDGIDDLSHMITYGRVAPIEDTANWIRAYC